jgi:hypothetical protein
MKNKLFGTNASKRRFEFADLCNIEDMCWADLVMWALGYTDFEDCYGQFCRPPKAPYAYCGKCDKYFEGFEPESKTLYMAGVEF